LDEDALEHKATVVNRAPIMMAWACVVAKRLGFSRKEALSIGTHHCSHLFSMFIHNQPHTTYHSSPCSSSLRLEARRQTRGHPTHCPTTTTTQRRRDDHDGDDNSSDRGNDNNNHDRGDNDIHDCGNDDNHDRSDNDNHDGGSGNGSGHDTTIAAWQP
jgi:hypothetical protein